MVKLELFNGSKTRSAWDASSPDFVDDWKPETRTIEAHHVQVTYATTVTLRTADDGGETVYEFDKEDPGLLIVDGVFYGDFTIVAA